MQYTTTGVFGKSSNVGTLMLAQRVGPERYADMLTKFGLGQRTGVGLPGESAGIVPPIDQWSGSTFSNLPIGQGLVDDPAADDGDVSDHRQRRGAGSAAHRPLRRRPRRQAHRRAAAGRHPGGVGHRPPRPCATCCVPSCNAIRRASSRAPGRRPRSTATRSAARPAPPSRSTRLRLLLRRRLLDHVRRHHHHRRPPLRGGRDDGQPAPRCRRQARIVGRAAVPQHRRAGCCSARTCRCHRIPARG